jgi:hypothetical protein
MDKAARPPPKPGTARRKTGLLSACKSVAQLGGVGKSESLKRLTSTEHTELARPLPPPKRRDAPSRKLRAAFDESDDADRGHYQASAHAQPSFREAWAP